MTKCIITITNANDESFKKAIKKTIDPFLINCHGIALAAKITAICEKVEYLATLECEGSENGTEEEQKAYNHWFCQFIEEVEII